MPQSVRKGSYSLTGLVISSHHEPLIGAIVWVNNKENVVETSLEGRFAINNLPEGRYKLHIELADYKSLDTNINLQATAHLEALVLTDSVDVHKLNDVVIHQKSEFQKLKESGFSVNVVDISQHVNSSNDLNQILNRTTGIRVRESGGMGSDFNFTLNGLSGKQIRFFIDGIPMENFGSSLSINNLPLSLIDRIEVYKGVVPIQLGSDVLGGAINIITKSTQTKYLDVSYYYGSFNTHRASLVGRYTDKKNRFLIKGNLFENYSDNNYKVDMEIPDTLGNYDGSSHRVRRFHDAYESNGAQVMVGLINRKYADEILIGSTVSGLYKEEQHGKSMDIVFGKVLRKNVSKQLLLQYKKSDLFIKHLNVRGLLTFSKNEEANVDTSSSSFNWFGQSNQGDDRHRGEKSYDKSYFTFSDVFYISNIGFDYKISRRHYASFNYTLNSLTRLGSDPLAEVPIPFDEPNSLQKQTLGLSYKYVGANERLSIETFGKYFIFKASTYQVDTYSETESFVNINMSKPGVGLATSYKMSPRFLLKASMEQAYRLPDAMELFGDGLLLKPNAKLQPEQSLNGNLGALWQMNGTKVVLVSEVNTFVRNSKNFIREVPAVVTSAFENTVSVRSMGAEGSLHVSYNNLFKFDMAATYQNLINTGKFTKEGKQDFSYLDRIPNIPFLFTSASIGIVPKKILDSKDQLNITLSSNYIQRFYLFWPSYGTDKNDIPLQFIQDLSIVYSRIERYHISFIIGNLWNTKAYDNFKIQKPGRSLGIKVRYFIKQ